MSSAKPVTEPISVNRNYRSEALKPGGVVMNANFIIAGDGAYGRRPENRPSIARG